MRGRRLSSIFSASVLITVFFLGAQGQNRPRVELGPPLIVEQPAGYAPGKGGVPVRDAFSTPTWLDTTNRSAILSSYQTVFGPSAPTSVGWTGSVDLNIPGTTAAAYRDAVLTRINWVRALAGVPANIALDATFNASDQKAALMMSANNQLSHFPPTSWKDYTADGANAAGLSNICLGFSFPTEFLSSDPGCIMGYMDDDGSNNTAVGHRRWLLVPQTQLMGTGDVTAFPSGSSNPTYESANAVFVQDGHLFDSRPATRDGFVAWPPKGYVPYQVVANRWSVSYASANFTNSTVTMSFNGSNVPVTLLPVQPGAGSFIGENTLAWVPSTDFTTLPSGDKTVTVTVNNVSGGPSGSTITYTVIIFDPSGSGGNLQPPVLTTPANGATGQPVTGLGLGWNASAGATSYDIIFSTVNPPTTNIGNVTGNGATITSTLSAATTYFWQIVAKNATQTASSSVFSFTTAGGGSPPPAPVLTTPANGATGVPIAAGLGWNSSSGATSYDVYFGTSSNPPFVTNTTGLTYSPGMAAGTLYFWKIVAKNAIGSTASSIQSFTTGAAATALQLITVVPCRVFDSRNATGTFGGPFIGGGTTRNIPVPSSSCGIPANAAAYSLNITVVPRNGTLGYLTVWPAGQTQPNVSTLNSPDGSILANAAIVPAGTGGAISVFALNNTDVIVDINGYFVTPTGGSLQFFPLTPCRILDTRGANGSFGGPAITAGTSRSVPFPSSSCGVPGNAAAYSLNVTAVPSGFLGYATAFPTGQSVPNVSTLNSLDGTVLANAAIVPAGSAGAVSFYANNTTNLVVDINGYFAAPSSGGRNFFTLTPCRLVDTRNATGSLGGPIMSGGATRTFPLPTSTCGLPSAAAYSLNVTVVPSGPLGYLTVWPAGLSQPAVSTLNAPKGFVVANAALVPAGTSGSVNVFVLQSTDVILDTNGYFQ